MGPATLRARSSCFMDLGNEWYLQVLRQSGTVLQNVVKEDTKVKHCEVKERRVLVATHGKKVLRRREKTEADFQVAHWEVGNVYKHFLAPSTEIPVKST